MTTIGPFYPTVIVDDPSHGSRPWNNPGRLSAADGVCADASGKNAATHYLKATTFAGLADAVPDDATDLAVTLTVTRGRGATGPGCVDDSVRLVVGGSPAGDDRAAPGAWPGTVADASYGGDSWGLVLAAADLKAPDFGLAVAARLLNGKLPTLAKVDAVALTVSYEVP